jgi:hypothetical protein
MQRDEALERLAGSGFPNVHFDPKHVLVIETRESQLLGPPHRETVIAIGMRATNREPERNAILSFTAYVQTTRPAPTIRKLSRLKREGDDFLPNPWKLGPEDWGEGEMLFSWGHDMDFLLGKDLSEEEALDAVASRLVLAVEDTLSQVSIEVPVPENWYRD